MMKVCLVLLALVAVANCIPDGLITSVSCEICLDFMDSDLNILLNEILNGGVVGGCGDLCNLAHNLGVTCNLLCDFVGIKEFVNIINQTDPDPIWYCQELLACPKVSGGAITITSCTSTPTSGPVSTTFQIVAAYTIINTTGPGLQVITLIPPDNAEPIGDDNFNMGQEPGQYTITWDIGTNSNFTAGQYGVQIQLCEGDCLNKHPYSGVYAQSTTSFTITQ